MALIFTDGFDHYGDTQVFSKWSSGTPFQVVAGLGRLGSAAAVIDPNRATACRVDLPIGTGGSATFLTTTLGGALRPVVMPAVGAAVIVAVWPCTDAAYEALYLLLDGDGRLELRRGPGNPLTSTDVGLRLCRTAAGTIDPVAIAASDALPYVEAMIRLDDWTQETQASGGADLFATQIRVNGKRVARAATQLRAAIFVALLDDDPVTSAALQAGTVPPAIGTVWSGLVLGSAFTPASDLTTDPPTIAGQVAVGDLYVLNSALPVHLTETTAAVSPTAVDPWTNPIPPRRVIDYRTFLGDVKVDLALPQARAYGGGPSGNPPFAGPGYVPWTVTGAATIEAALRRATPDDAIYIEATAVDQIDALQYLLQPLLPFWPAGLTGLGPAAFDGTGVAHALGEETTGIQYSAVLELPILAVVRWLRLRRTGATGTIGVTQQLALGMDTNWASGVPATVMTMSDAVIGTDFAYHGAIQYAPYPPGAIKATSGYGLLGPGTIALPGTLFPAATSWDLWRGHPVPGATWALRYFFPAPAPHYDPNVSSTLWPTPFLFGARTANPPTFSPPNPANAYLSAIELGLKVTAI